jgi:hypothetical protein
MKHSTGWLVLGALTACTPEYAYVPTTNATIAGTRVAADYKIPASSPRGEVQLESYGITDVTPNEAPGERVRALHMRAIIMNNSGADWTFDTRAQQLELGGHGTTVPGYATANRGSSPPIVTVPAGGKRVVDLFYPLPADLQHAAQIPDFDAIWRVQTDQGITTQRTPFERVELEAPDSYYASGLDYGPDYYWGGPYWYNPYYLDYPFYGAYGGRYGGGVGIHRSAHPGGFAPRGGFGGGFHGGGDGFHGGGGGGGGHR